MLKEQFIIQVNVDFAEGIKTLIGDILSFQGQNNTITVYRSGDIIGSLTSPRSRLESMLIAGWIRPHVEHSSKKAKDEAVIEPPVVLTPNEPVVPTFVAGNTDDLEGIGEEKSISVSADDASENTGSEDENGDEPGTSDSGDEAPDEAPDEAHDEAPKDPIAANRLPEARLPETRLPEVKIETKRIESPKTEVKKDKKIVDGKKADKNTAKK